MIDISSTVILFRTEIAQCRAQAGYNNWTWRHLVPEDLNRDEIMTICRWAECWAREYPEGIQFYVNQNHSSWR